MPGQRDPDDVAAGVAHAIFEKLELLRLQLDVELRVLVLVRPGDSGVPLPKKQIDEARAILEQWPCGDKPLLKTVSEHISSASALAATTLIPLVLFMATSNLLGVIVARRSGLGGQQ